MVVSGAIGAPTKTRWASHFSAAGEPGCSTGARGLAVCDKVKYNDMSTFAATGLMWVLLISYAAIPWFPVAIVTGLVQLASAFSRRVKSSRQPAALSVAVEEPNLQSLPRLPIVIHWLVTLAPVLLFVALLLMAWRARVLIGHWPQVMADDPKWIGKNDVLYQRLYDFADLAFGLAGWSFIAWIVIFFAAYSTYTTRQRKVIA